MKYITGLINILRGSGFMVLINEHEDCNTDPLEEITTMFLFFPIGSVTTVENGYSIILRILKSLSLYLHN